MKNIWNKSKAVMALKILLFCGILAGEVFLWMIGSIFICFGSVNPGSMIIFWTLFLLSLLVLFFSLLFRKARKIWIWSGSSALLCLLVLCLIPAYRWYTVERFKQLSDNINWHAYDPWRAYTKVVVVEAASEFKIAKDLPKMDGAYALYPVYSGVVRALYDRNEFEKHPRWKYLDTNGSDITFEKLLKNEV
ncbi:MAG: hypothetical protein IJC34_01565, partial [Lentisphaeria bacterium]|nr:hypothetical protein [Lentisphaeria bacterium]